MQNLQNSLGMIEMPGKCVLDSCVIAAIFFREEASSRAVESVQNRDLITVDLAMAEVSNVAWKRVTLFQEKEEIIVPALENSIEFINTVCKVINTRELITRSFEIALKEKISFYDSLFLAAAQKEKVPLITLDKRLKNTEIDVELL
jgi:predicted nucleic acid-binding protein